MDNLYDKLIEYANSDYYGFHMPGHKRNTFLVRGENPYKYDITEIDRFDDLHHPVGILQNEMENAARVFGAERTRFLVNGSTCGILAAVSAASEKKKKIVVARNSHKSVYNAVMLCGLAPIYIYPNNGGAYNVSELRDILDKNSDVAAVVITSPTYEGIVCDVESICHAAHENNVPVIVDQAHGAHFGMHEYFPESAVALGADIVTMSLHKTLPAMTQTAFLHINGDLVDYRTVDKYLGIYQSSSPSYVLMGSIANCVRLIQEKGVELFEGYVEMLQALIDGCANLKHIHIFTKADAEREGIFGFDRSKIVIILNKKFSDENIDGRWLYDTLIETYHLQMEMAAPDYVLAMTSIADTQEGFSRLAAALHEIDGELEENNRASDKIRGLEKNIAKDKNKERKEEKGQEKDKINGIEKDENEEEIVKREQNGARKIEEKNNINYSEMFLGAGVCESPACIEMPLHETLAAETETVELAKASGRVSAEYLYMYPPGIPIIAPGEKITGEIIAAVGHRQQQGFNLYGAEDLSAREIKVLKLNIEKI